MKKTLSLAFILCVLALLPFGIARGATITKTTPSIIFDFNEEENIIVGKKYFVVNENEKKVAVIKVMKIKNNKALAKLVKGKVSEGNSLKLEDKKSNSDENESEDDNQNAKSDLRKSSWYILGGISSDNMTVKISSSLTVSMTGMGYNLSIVYKKFLYKDFSMTLEGLYDQFNVSGSNSLSTCLGSSNCTVQIAYLFGSGNLQWNFINSKSNQSYVGGGFGLAFPSSKSTNILDSNKISTTYAIIFQGGTIIKTKSKWFIPIGLDYYLFPSTDSVNLNQTIVRSGIGRSF